METYIDTTDPVGLIESLWSLPGALGPIATAAVLVVFLVKLTRDRLTTWIPWFATPIGGLTLVWGHAFLASIVTQAVAGVLSLPVLLVQAAAAAFTATGLRSQAKAATKKPGEDEAVVEVREGGETVITYPKPDGSTATVTLTRPE